MIVKCVWEHNGNDTLLYADELIGAYTRGEDLNVATEKMQREATSYLRWSGVDAPTDIKVRIVQEKTSDLLISDADSDVIFDSERKRLTLAKYNELKSLALKSAEDFLELYNSIGGKNATDLPIRRTFYGNVPRTANEMYEHTKNVNEYYFGEIGVNCDNAGTILDCRRRGFEVLEKKANFLTIGVIKGSWDEEWSVSKVCRRFIWHDRIHAKAMWRMATGLLGNENVKNPFFF